MKNKSGIEKLLSDVLALQQEDGRGAELTEEQVRDVLLGAASFTDADNTSLRTHRWRGALTRRLSKRWRSSAKRTVSAASAPVFIPLPDSTPS